MHDIIANAGHDGPVRTPPTPASASPRPAPAAAPPPRRASLPCRRGRGISAQHKKATPRKRMQVPAREVPQPAPDPVAHHRGAHRAAHDEADLRGLIAARPDQHVRDQQGPADPVSVAHRGAELRAASHPGARGQHEPSPPRRRCCACLGRAGQTLTRARPLRRLAARIARPARVRMRSLKPCVFARRRLFGWNVRLLTATPESGCVSWVARPPPRSAAGRSPSLSD